MTTQPIRQPLSRVGATELGRADGPTDGQLLGRFVEERDEAALAALVRRLGPVVLGVCRRIVGDAHLAEDAFQATFLVLVRRAEVIRPREQVGAWLYGVAYRVARRVRAVRARRLAKEQPVSAPIPTAPDSGGLTSPGSPDTADLLPVLDEELARLPDHHRAAVLACDLEGQTRKEAARRLGIPEGTLSNRLAAARRTLARRLTRRGVTPGVAVLLSASATARVSAALVDATVQFAAGPAPSGVPAAFAEGELKMLLLTKLRGLTAAVAIVLGIGIAAGTIAASVGDAAPQREVAPTPAVGLVPANRFAARPADTPAPMVIDNDGPLDDLAFSPDGKLIAAQTRVKEADGLTVQTHAIRLWDVKTGNLVKTLVEQKNLHGVAFSPDGKHVAAAVGMFDRNKVKPGDVRDAFSAEVVLWDVESGKEAARLTDSTAHILYNVAFSADGKYVAAGGGLLAAESAPAGGEVTVWDAKTGKVLWANQDHKGAVRRLAFSPDGKLLATPADDGTVRVWDSFTGKPLKTLTVKDGVRVYSAAFSPDGTLLAAGGSDDGSARVWDVASGELKQVVNGGYDGGIQVVRFLPDGTLVTAGTAERTDGNLKFWDVKTGKRLRAIADPSLGMRSMAISPDGKTAAVGSFLKTLVIVPLGK